MKKTIVLSFLAILLTLSSCQDSTPGLDHPETLNPNAVEKRFTKGGAPVEVVILLSRKEIELTDYLTVSITIEYKEGVEIAPPLLYSAIYSPLLLVESPREKTYWSEKDNVIVNRWIYKFEPVASGEFELKPFDVRFRLEKEKTDPPDKWPVYKIHTETIPYLVKSIDVLGHRRY